MGMLKSMDGGRSWSLLGASSLARAAVRRVRVHPENPNVVEVTASRSGNGRDSRVGTPGSPPFGILKSTDGGTTWVRTLSGVASALEVDSTNFNNQYAAIGNATLSQNGVYNDAAGSLPNGVYRSIDGGQTWASIPGPWGISTPAAPSTGRIELAIAPSNPDVLYASIDMPRAAGSGRLLGLYRTDNAWDATPEWIRVPTDATGSDGYCGPGKCGYSHVISVDPRDPNRLIAGGVGLWKCTNCSSSPVWAAMQGTHSDYHALAWAGNRLIVGNDGGIWSYPDVMFFQTHNTGLPTLMFYSGALHPTDADFMLGGLRDFPGAAVRTRDNVWRAAQQLPSPGHWGEAEVALSSSHPETDWMVADTLGGIYRTTDGGRTGISAIAGLDKTNASFIAPVRKCPANDDVFVTGTNRMWRTDDFFGSTEPHWIANGPTYPNLRDSPGTIQAITFVPSDTSCNSYADGNYGGQVQLTRDGGRSWTDLDPGKTLPPRPVNSIAFDPTNANVAYVAISSFDDVTPDKPGHVFKSTNALSASPSWVNVSPTLNQPFNVVAVDPVNPSLVYAGSDTGLWRSADGAATWARMGLENGLPPATVYDIQINPVTRRTVVFTFGRGAYALEQ
jgi:photosystem II stability/assembly factor-like uncharacterized protein